MSAPSPSCPDDAAARRLARSMAVVSALCLTGDTMLYIALPLFWQECGLTALWQVGVLLAVNRLVRLPLNPLVRLLYTRIDQRTGMALAVVLAAFLSGAMRRSLGQMVDVVSAISRGRLQRRLRRLPGTEFAPLAEAVNRMADSIGEQVRIAVNGQTGRAAAVVFSDKRETHIVAPLSPSLHLSGESTVHATPVEVKYVKSPFLYQIVRRGGGEQPRQVAAAVEGSYREEKPKRRGLLGALFGK